MELIKSGPPFVFFIDKISILYGQKKEQEKGLKRLDSNGSRDKMDKA